MKNLLPVFRTEIVGRDVTNILLDEEGLGLSLSGGWDITVWSAITCFVHGKEVDLHRISELIGSSLLKFVDDGVRERLVFSNGFELIVDLDMRKPSQPEAMMVHGPENLIIVWNE